MTISYQKIEVVRENGTMTTIQATLDDGTIMSIPTDPANADYQAYLNKDTLPSNSSIPQAGE